MNILVIGGLHGNELLGIRLVEMLRKSPIQNVDYLIGNPRAVQKQIRFTESDLNRSFGKEMTTYEMRRARYITKRCEQYDAVLDFHNTQTPQNNTCFTGVDRVSYLDAVASTLGFTTSIEATYDCINKYCPNVLSVEVSIGDRLDDAEYWYHELEALSTKDVRWLETASMSRYRFLRRVTWQEKQMLALEEWKPFQALSEVDKKKLTLCESIVVAIFIGSRLTQYYATLLIKQ